MALPRAHVGTHLEFLQTLPLQAATQVPDAPGHADVERWVLKIKQGLDHRDERRLCSLQWEIRCGAALPGALECSAIMGRRIAKQGAPKARPVVAELKCDSTGNEGPPQLCPTPRGHQLVNILTLPSRAQNRSHTCASPTLSKTLFRVLAVNATDWPVENHFRAQFLHSCLFNVEHSTDQSGPSPSQGTRQHLQTSRERPHLVKYGEVIFLHNSVHL